MPTRGRMDSYLSNRCFSAFSGPDPDDVFELRDEDLPVADLAGLGLFLYGGNDFFRHAVRDHSLDLHLRDEGDVVFRTPVELDMSLLPAEPLYLGHGHTLHADRIQRVLHVIELERLDDGFDLFHSASFGKVVARKV